MRKLFSKYTYTTVFISIFIIFLLAFSTKTFAFEVPKYDEKDFKFLPNFICVILELPKCDGSQPTPDPNQPTPPHPTPEILPTNIPSKPGFCMPPGGLPLCGSRDIPLAGCGHCGVGYPPDQQKANCNNGKDENWGTAYAIDILKQPLAPILLPSIEGQNVIWYHYGERKYVTNAIQRYSTTVKKNENDVGKKYILQFHHTQIGSGIGIGREASSGQLGGRVCQTCDHVHIQIYQEGWKSAPNYYCH